MEKRHFLYKLIAPRPTFHLDMNDAEKEAMGRHMGYWAALTEKRTSVVYGPVFDPNGVYGMAVVELNENEDANDIGSNDPAVSSGICTFELIPMQVGMMRQ
jgi:uncharacterized protein YciI